MLLNHKDLTLEEAGVVSSALAICRRRPVLGFSDCLMLEAARKAGHLPLGTFDRALGKLDGALVLEPRRKLTSYAANRILSPIAPSS